MKTILFDWGGVLANSESVEVSHFLSLKYNLDYNDLKEYWLSIEEIYDLGNNSEDFINVIADKYNIPAKEIKRLMLGVKPNEVYNFAKELKSKGFKLYLLSNQKKFKGEYIKKEYDLSIFRDIFFSYELGYIKPSDKYIDYFIEITKEEPDNCVFIDDDLRNINKFKEKSFNTIQFKDLNQLKEELKNFI